MGKLQPVVVQVRVGSLIGLCSMFVIDRQACTSIYCKEVVHAQVNLQLGCYSSQRWTLCTCTRHCSGVGGCQT